MVWQRLGPQRVHFKARRFRILRSGRCRREELAQGEQCDGEAEANRAVRHKDYATIHLTKMWKWLGCLLLATPLWAHDIAGDVKVQAYLKPEEAERVLKIGIEWGRYGEVYEYVYNTGMLTLPREEREEREEREAQEGGDGAAGA